MATITSVDIESRIASQNQTAAIGSRDSSSAADSAAKGSFATALATLSARKGITFSGHAQTRLASRQIKLTDDDMSRLGDALDKASAKGARSSLVLMDSAQSGKVGLVVSVPNRTVITAVDTMSLKENIFTNIDSAMLV